MNNSNDIINLPGLSKEEIKKFKRQLRVPENGREFEILQLILKTFTRKYSIKRNKNQTNFLEILVTDGVNRTNTVQIFTRNMNVNSCSCKYFKTNQLGFCQHLAVCFRVKSKLISANNIAQTHHIRSLMNYLPMNKKSFRANATKIFNPTKQQEEIIGIKRNSVEIIEASSVDKLGTYNIVNQKSYQKNFDNTLKQLKKQKVSSNGLLSQIKLYDYQEDIFLKMIASKRSICSMVMGSGKTACTIAVYEWIRKNKNNDLSLLIVAPKSLKLQWGTEINRIINREVFQINNAKDLEYYKSNKPQIATITYQLLAKKVDEIKTIDRDMIVYDEMQFIRNGETKTWKAINKLKAEYMYGLSGTIIENKLDDLYSVMNILAPDFLGPKWKFDMEYQNLTNITKTSIFYRGVKNIEDLKEKLQCFIFSYDKLSLPNITYNNIEVNLDADERSFHDTYMEKAKILLAKMMNGGLSFHEKSLLQAYLLKARQSTDTKQLVTKEEGKVYSGKIKKLLDLVNKICIQQQENVVLFSSWTEMLDIIQDHIQNKFGNQIQCLMYTGRESMKKRNQAVIDFKTPSPNNIPKIFLASDAGGLGVDGLQHGSRNIIHFELPWNPAKVDQRNARCHRIGQTKDVNVYYVIANNSIETQISEALENKRAIRYEVLYLQ